MVIYFVAVIISIFVFYSFGMACLVILERLFGEDYKSAPFHIVQLLGMIIVSNLFTYYAIYFPLNWFSFFIVVVTSGLLFIKLNDRPDRSVSSIVRGFMNGTNSQKILAIILLLFTLVLGQYPPLIGDTGYYHAQSVRWLQEFGLVPGLGNLQVQYAHNHSWFILEAIFGIAWLNNSPLHIMNGLIFLTLIFYCFDGIKEIRKKKIQLSIILKLTTLPFCIVYLSKYIASLSPDLSAAAIIIILSIFFIERFEKKELTPIYIAVFLILSSYLITIKVSTLPIAILSIYFIIKMKNLYIDNYKFVFIKLFLVMIVLMPWFISGYLFSGYLVFPFSEIDLFNADWEMSRQSVINYKKSLYTDNWNPLLSGTEIELTNIFNKQYYTFFNFPVSVFSWIGTWLKQFSIQDKFLFFFLIGSIINLVFITVFKLFYPSDFFKRKQNEYFIVSIISFVAILLWFMNAPSIRYGYGFIIIMIALQVSFWLLFFYQLKDIKYQRWVVFFTLFSIVLILFDIEMKNFMVQRSLNRNQYDQVYNFIDVRGKSTLEELYNFDNKNQMYVMELFLPLPDKIRIIKIFLKSKNIKFFDNADANYPTRSSKGNYRPNDGLLGISKRSFFPSKYPINSVKEVQFGTFTFYEMSADIKSWGGWYESFPFSPGYLNRIELRGTTLKNGFRPKY